MSAVAVKRSVAPAWIPEEVSTSCGFRVVSRRRSRKKFSCRLWKLAALTSFVFVLAYIGIYAAITALCYRNFDLSRLCRAQEIENERLRVAITLRLSPRQIAIVAQKAGMVRGGDYEYLTPPRSVASAQ